jgi:hypothetical protein
VSEKFTNIEEVNSLSLVIYCLATSLYTSVIII